MCVCTMYHVPFTGSSFQYWGTLDNTYHHLMKPLLYIKKHFCALLPAVLLATATIKAGIIRKEATMMALLEVACKGPMAGLSGLKDPL